MFNKRDFRKKPKLKSGILLLILLAFSHFSFAQQQSPCDANPFCSDSSYVFPNTTNAGNAINGPNYGCLTFTPNAIWYYMQIGTAGTLQMSLVQSSAGSSDIDFAMWGPFTDLATGCLQVLGGVAPIQCSYSTFASETLGIGLPGGSNQIGQGASTPPPAQVGEVYIVILTNYGNSPGTISFNQTGGTGSADCSILYCNLETSNSGPVCAGKPFQVIATNDTAQYYLWEGPFGLTSNSPTPTFTINQPGDYTFNVTSYIGTDTCTGTTTVTIWPSVYDTSYAEICQGETFDFLGDLLYEQGQYNKVFSNTSGCDSILTLNLVVNPLPNVQVPEFRKVEICEGGIVSFGLTNPEANISYQWVRNGQDIPGETGDQITTDIPGTYHVKAESAKGCKATSKNFTLVVNPNPNATIVRSEGEIPCAFDTITLTAEYNANYNYYWSPEKPFKAITGTQTNKVKGIFINPETAVELTVVNEFGCTGSDAMVVRTIPCCEVFVPNAFSPNNDNVNDYFKPVLERGQILTVMRIFDRYGKMVYDNTSPKLGWDGNYPNGSPANPDAYMYYIQYTCSDGEVYTKKESVILVR